MNNEFRAGDLRAIHYEMDAEFNKLMQGLEDLTIVQRLAIAQKLLGENSGLTVVLGGNNVINNSFAIQINGDAPEISKQLEELPPETFAELLKAIAIRISKD